MIPADSNHHQTYFAQIASMVRKGMTLRQIYMTYERGLTTLRGTATTIADHMQEWIEEGADGFMLIFPSMPGGLEAFVEHVVPELQNRKLLRRKYEGKQLRDHLGLTRPENRYLSC